MRSRLVMLGVACCAATGIAALLGRRLMQVAVSPAEIIWRKWYLVHALCRWDSEWYVRIAQDGYWYREGAQGPVAFFPAYPLLIKLASAATTAHGYLTGIALSMVAGVACVVLMGLWAERTLNLPAGRAALALVLFPFSFFLFGPVYSDGLFLVLALGAFSCVERRWLVGAALLAAAATACRPVGAAVVLGLWLRHWELKRALREPWAPRDAVLSLAPVGLLAYMVHLRSAVGDPLAWLEVQAAWGHQGGAATLLKAHFFEVISGKSPGEASRIFYALHALSGVGAFVLAWAVYRRLGAAYAVYVAAVMGIPLLGTKDFYPMGRYATAAFPVFAVAAAAQVGRRLELAPAVACGAGFIALAFLYGAGVYVG